MEDWKLSSFDTFCLGMNIKGAWLYEETPSYETMRASLKTLLDSYPTLLGHFSPKESKIICDTPEADDAVIDSVFAQIERTDISLDELVPERVQSGIARPAKIWTLAPQYDIKGFKKGLVRPFSATLIKLKDGAALIVSAAHAVMDGESFYNLVEQWAELCKGREIVAMRTAQDKLPSPAAMSREETIRTVAEYGWPKIKLGKMIKMLIDLGKGNSIRYTYVHELSQERLGELKAASGAGANAVLCAVAAKDLFTRLGDRKEFKLVITADMRNRFTGIDSSFFGNFSQAQAMPLAFDSSKSIEELAADIDKEVKRFLGSDIPEKNIRLSVCALAYGLPVFQFDASDMNCSRPSTINVNNQLKFRPGELDWGCGLPRYAFPNELSDMVKLWQPVAGGAVQIIYGGLTAKIMAKN